MTMSRRHLLAGAAFAPFGGRLLSIGRAQAQAPGGAVGSMPPIIFVHGNGDHAALWLSTLWRFESNDVPSDRLLAVNFTDPLARSDDAVPQANRSSTEDQRRELAEAVADLSRRTGAARVALVANSRGGYAIRNLLQNGGSEGVSHAVLCGVPNHGVYDWDEGVGGEFNGRGPFLRRLNAGDSEVTPGTAYLTIRSDGNDKYAQPDGRFVGKPGVPTGVTAEGPALRGATNTVLPGLDHREVAFHPRAFREMYRFIAGAEPARIAIAPEPRVTLDGLVTGLAGAVPTNRPVAGASVEIYRVSGETGERMGERIHQATTTADGRWGPATVDPASFLEIVVSMPGAPITHYYRSPFPRSSRVVHLRPGRALGQADQGAGAVVLMTRPRGYFGLPRDVVLLDGREPKDVAPGVPTDSTTTVRLPASEVGRAVVALFKEERIVARAWPAAENRIAVAELTF
jgi:pimeloyl-ACP methyl ester carboxylesterase